MGIQREVLSGFAIKIENVQSAKSGTGGLVAAEFKRQTTIKALRVAVHHTREEIGAGVA